LAFSIDVVVLEMKPDFDPWGNEYIQVSLGYKQPVPFAPPQQPFLQPQPKQISYKHALHIIIPKEEWKDQYSMFQQFRLIVNDDGTQELKRQ
jgi:hypothetical protein